MPKQHSKPLRPRGSGLTFVPDSMKCREDRWWYFDNPHEGTGRDAYMRHATWRRAHRKRQRRVDQYMIRLGLESDHDFGFAP